MEDELSKSWYNSKVISHTQNIKITDINSTGEFIGMYNAKMAVSLNRNYHKQLKGRGEGYRVKTS